MLAQEAFGSGGGEVGLTSGEVELDAGADRDGVVLAADE